MGSHLTSGRGAQVEISTATMLRGGLPPAQTQILLPWVAQRRQELDTTWNQASQGQPPGSVPYPYGGVRFGVMAEPTGDELVMIRGLHVLGHMRVRLLFSDGLVRDLDLSPTLTGPAFARHRSEPAFFARVRVRHGTVTWPDDSDLDAQILHGDEAPAAGAAPRVLGEVFPVAAAS